MQIVIDIPEQMYLNAKADKLCCPAILDKAIKNGTPLPKGHGDLVDKNDVLISLMGFIHGKKTIGQCIDDTLVLVKAKVPQEGAE